MSNPLYKITYVFGFREFNAFSSIVTASPIKQIPEQLFDNLRNQWKSTDVLRWALMIVVPRDIRLHSVRDTSKDILKAIMIQQKTTNKVCTSRLE